MHSISPEELLKAAVEISATAAAIPMRYFRSDLAIEDKADESPVTIADRETEKHIRAAIAERFPSHGIFGEEFGKSGEGSEFTWIVDPIDGTRSFITGVPLFGMLIAVMQGDEAVAGIIRMPALGECIAGCRGGRTTWNGTPVRCRTTRDLAEAWIIINEGNQMVTREPARLARLMQAGRTRRFLNDCYPFALLAMGRIDAVVDFDLQPYDYMAAVPVIEAAGGIITDWHGAPLGLTSDGSVLAAATPEIHAELLALLR